MAKEVQTKGCTLVPLKIYFKSGKAKLLVGVGKSKAQQDKRESIAKRRWPLSSLSTQYRGRAGQRCFREGLANRRREIG